MERKITCREIHGLSAALVAFSVAACSGGGAIPQRTTTSVVTPSLSAAHAPKYRLVVLGDGLFPNKINENGVVVGYADVGSTLLAFEYKNGRLTDLPPLAGDSSSEANDVNNHDQIVGQSPFGGVLPQHAILWQNGKVTDLGAVAQAPGSAPNDFNAALAINNAGEIVGYSGPASANYVTVFSPASPHGISLGGSVLQGAATGINDEGEVVGIASTPSAFVTFAYPNPATCLPPTTVGGFALVNDRGDTLWPSDSFLTTLLCTNGIGVSLHLVGGRMNNRGDVVGQDTEPTQYRGLLYEKGSYFVLNSLVNDAENIDFVPTSVNNGGEITGFAMNLSDITAANAEQTMRWYFSARANPQRYRNPPVPDNHVWFGFLLVPE